MIKSTAAMMIPPTSIRPKTGPPKRCFLSPVTYRTVRLSGDRGIELRRWYSLQNNRATAHQPILRYAVR
jgi:hypothetical protein